MARGRSAADDLCEVCVTAPDADWLGDLVARLVTERLCACGHVTSGVRSLYRWQGEVHDESEALAALHTRRELVAPIVSLVQSLHPYEVPGISVRPLVDGSAAYLQWIRDETTAVAPR